METPPYTGHTRYQQLGLARDELLQKLESKNYFKRDLFSQAKPSERDSTKKALDDLRKQLRFLSETQWMFEQPDAWQGVFPL
jgi:hypothetical protein